MAGKLFTALILFILLLAIFNSCSRGYRGSAWYSPSRSNYNNFRGGGPGWGK